MGAERTWSTAEVVHLIAEAHDRPVPNGGPNPIDYMPWLERVGSGAGTAHRHDQTAVTAALIYSAIPHGGSGSAGRRPWHASTALAIAASSAAGVARWAIIDPTDGSWFVTSTQGIPENVARRTVGLLVHLIDLDNLRAVIGGRR